MSYAPNQTQVATPTTGQTVQAITGPRVTLVLNPSSLLATCTVAFPASPQDRDVFVVGTTKAVTVMTMTCPGGTTILNGLTSMALGGFGRWQYMKSLAMWIRIG